MKLVLLLSVVLVCQADVVPQEEDKQDIVVFKDGLQPPDFGLHDLIVIPIPPIIPKMFGAIVEETINRAMSMNPMDMEMTTELDPLMATETQRKKRSTPFTSETVESFTNLPDNLE